MKLRKEEVDGSTEITIEVNEDDMSWFKELFSTDEKSFFWADKGVILWFVKEER